MTKTPQTGTRAGSADFASAVGGQVTIPELRNPELPQQKFGGYSRPHVEEILARAAGAIGALSSRVDLLERQLAEASKSAPVPTALADATELLLASQRVATSVKDEAKQEVEQLIADAQRDAEEARGLREQAALAFEASRAEAAAIVEKGKTERHDLLEGANALIAEASARAATLVAEGEVERQRIIDEVAGNLGQIVTELEARKTALELSILGHRDAWRAQLQESLELLDGIDAELHRVASNAAAELRQ